MKFSAMPPVRLCASKKDGLGEDDTRLRNFVTERSNEIGFREFVALMASLIAMVALSIDAMLPALMAIGEDLGATDPNDPQLVIGLFFLGMAVAQLLYGPLSDSFGRKPTIFLGLIIYLIGSALCLVSWSLSALIAGRIIQGIGAAGPRIVANAIIRDRYEGRPMASVTSLVMSVFIVVPVFAPLVGQGIMALSDWRMIFWFLAALAAGLLIWSHMRLTETLSVEARKPFRTKPIFLAMREVLANRLSLGCTLCMGLIFASFLAFLSSAQQVLGEAYALGDWFPVTFSCLATVVGVTSAFNSKLVLRHGMQRMATIGIFTVIGASAFFALWSLLFGFPPLPVALLWLACSVGSIGIVFGNLNAMAMEPLGHIAGVGAAVVGALSSLVSVTVGTQIARSYDGTALPIALGYIVCGLCALLALSWGTRGRVRKVRTRTSKAEPSK